MRTPPLTTSPLTPLFCNIIILFPQIWFLLRLLHAHRVPLLALLPGVQDAPQLQCQALSRRVSPWHVGGPHEDPQGRQVREIIIDEIILIYFQFLQRRILLHG